MTTIAYRNGIMAGDRRVTNHNIIEPDVTKIFKRDSDGALIGAAGTLGLATRFTRWFLAGEKGEPPELFDKDGGCEAEAIIVRPNCHPETHDRYGVIHLESDYYAIGSGSCAALTALDLGFSAIEAVDAAARRDTGTGPKHDVLHLGAAISALTPPLQHKGGETEVGSRLAAFKERFQGFIKADLPEGYIAWEGGACPAEISDPIGPVPYVELKFSDGDTHGTRLAHTYNWTGKSSDLSIEPHIIGYRIFSSSEADSGPGSEAPAGDARIEQTISTLQASSGEGETDETELAAFLRLEGAVKHNGGPRPIPVGSHMEMLTRGCGVWPVRNIEEFSSHWHWDGEEEHPTNIIAYRPIEAPASSTLSTTEPAAYSPVNNADEPVTKPEADVFYHGLQAEAEAKKDPVSKLFGAGGLFGKREVVS